MTTKHTEKKRSAQITPIVVALIGAAATLAAAFFGNKGSFTAILPGNPTRIIAASPVPQVTVTVTKTASPGSPIQPPGIYHQGTLVLDDNNADLDAPPSDPQWGVLQLPPSGSYDISVGESNTSIALFSNVQAVQLKQATNSSCSNVTGYSTNQLGVNVPLKIGQYICVHTSDGRFSLLKILELTSNKIVLYVKTFKDAND